MDTLPIEGITVSKIRNCLSSNGGNVNNNIVSFFKNTAKINKWSKHKPIANGLDEVDYADYWKGTDGKCGFNFSLTSSYSNVEFLYNNNNWSYTPPAERTGTAKRMGDFRGYYPKATPPIKSISKPMTITNQVGDGAIFTLMIKATDNPNELSLSDFPAISEGYFGVYVYNLDGTDSTRATSTTKLKNGGVSVNISSSNLSLGQYRAVPFIATTNPMKQNEADKTNSYTTLPIIEPFEFKIVSSDIGVLLTAEYDELDSTSVIVKAEIVSGVNGKVLSGNQIQLRYGNSTATSPIHGSEQYRDVADWTVDLNSINKTRIFRFNNVTDNQLTKIILTLDRNKYIFQTTIKHKI